VVEKAGDVEMRVVVAEVLAATANAVLVAKKILKLGAHLTTALALCRCKISRKKKRSLEVGSTRNKKSAGEWRNVKHFAWQFGTGNKEIKVSRARVSRTGKLSCLPNFSSFELWAPSKSKLGVDGCGREIFASATCSLQLAKASAATLSQQKENDSADVQRGIVYISGFLGKTVS
jgi:hypothetical protein